SPKCDHYYSAALRASRRCVGFYPAVATGPSPPGIQTFHGHGNKRGNVTASFRRISTRSPHRHDRDSECGAYSRRWDPKRTRKCFRPPAPGTAPRSARKPGVLISHQTAEAVSVLLRLYRTLRCFEAMIEKDTRRQKGRPPRSDGAAGQKKEALFSTRRYRPNARRAALSKTDRAQSVYWLPALRAAWRIARFSPARNRTLINSPR